jgi:hypothetical protein
MGLKDNLLQDYSMIYNQTFYAAAILQCMAAIPQSAAGRQYRCRPESTGNCGTS